MNRRLLFPLALMVATAVVSGCDQGIETPPRTDVRVINVAPSYPSLDFQRERTTPETISFRTSRFFDYGEDTYDFQVLALFPGFAEVVATFRQALFGGTIYTIVLTEMPGGSVEEVVLEAPMLSASSTETSVNAFHGAADAAGFDLYLQAPSTAPGAAPPWGTLTFGQSLTPSTIAPGDYVLMMTEPGNPANVQFTSPPFTLISGGVSTFVIASEAGETATPVSVVLNRASSVVLLDTNAQGGLRVINGASDALPRDVAVNGEYMPPLFPSAPFALDTAYAPVPRQQYTVSVTPAGNTSVIEHENLFAPGAPTWRTAFIVGDPGALQTIEIPENTRRLATGGRIRFLNASDHGLLFFVLPSGMGVNTVLPNSVLDPSQASVQSTLEAGAYDIVALDGASGSIVAGPVPVTLAARGLYSVLAVNGPDTASVTLALLDDF